MRKYLFLLASLGFGLGACTNDTLNPEDGNVIDSPEQEQTVSNLKTARLASVASSQGRVNLVTGTRAEDENQVLSLYAEITNPSSEIAGFVKETRDMSATSVYYDQNNDVYYVSYHMQGNNYNTTQKYDTGGFIESFTIGNNGPQLGKIYSAADPSTLSFDFNHLLIDNLVYDKQKDYYSQFIGDYTVGDGTEQRIIAVGHSSEPSSKEGGLPNTKAIIAQIDLENNLINYQTVLTGEKLLDEDGKSLGDIDAQDVNCVVRKYNHYFLATRKGIAILKAAKDKLFDPELDADDNVYFLKTPGSVKYIGQPTTTSCVDFFFLTEDTPKDMTGETSIPGRVIQCAINNYFRGEHRDLPVGMESVTDFNWQSGSAWPKVNDPIESVSPVDGKNVFFSGSLNTAAQFACLGKNGLYINNPTLNWANPVDHIMKFSDTAEGSRPVNGLFVEDWDAYNGHHYTDGFIYVANGACLTILDYYTLEKVAEYSAFDGTGEASANFIHVVKTNEYPDSPYVPSRIITVAYGQAGVKVFKFNPPVK